MRKYCLYSKAPTEESQKAVREAHSPHHVEGQLVSVRPVQPAGLQQRGAAHELRRRRAREEHHHAVALLPACHVLFNEVTSSFIMTCCFPDHSDTFHAKWYIVVLYGHQNYEGCKSFLLCKNMFLAELSGSLASYG